jgi:uncharacterized surface protein with fasciclin (FAS1) repeats
MHHTRKEKLVKNFGALALAALLIVGGMAAIADAQAMNSMSSMSSQDPMVGGSAMSPEKNIIQNAVNSKDHTTLVALVKKAGLVQTLEGPGPFTVFAPTNEAFSKLPTATVDKVTGDKALLTKVLTYHVIAGKLSAADIVEKIKAGNGKATLTTVEGGNITAMLDGNSVVLVDDHGGKATVTIADVNQSNGVIHVINAVLIP